jgi:hypothetical protein
VIRCRLNASRLALVLVGIAACGNPSNVVVDGAIDPLGDATDAPKIPCWPMATAMPRGSIELGTGSTYREMPEELPLVYGSQNGFHIEARSRIQGLEPGDPFDTSNPLNPRSRFLAFFLTGPMAGQPNVGTTCASRIGYMPDGDGFLFATPYEIRFDTALGPAELFDQQFRVVIEIIDASGGYAIDEKTITARAPVGWNPMPDAGP